MTDTGKIYLFTQILALVALITVLHLHLLPALLGGLLVYHLVEFGARMLGHIGVIAFNGKIIFLALLSLVVITAFAFASVEFVNYITSGPESMSALLQRMADVIDTGRTYLPAWTQQYLPANIEDWQ